MRSISGWLVAENKPTRAQDRTCQSESHIAAHRRELGGGTLAPHSAAHFTRTRLPSHPLLFCWWRWSASVGAARRGPMPTAWRSQLSQARLVSTAQLTRQLRGATCTEQGASGCAVSTVHTVEPSVRCACDAREVDERGGERVDGAVFSSGVASSLRTHTFLFARPPMPVFHSHPPSRSRREWSLS